MALSSYREYLQQNLITSAGNRQPFFSAFGQKLDLPQEIQKLDFSQKKNYKII